MKRLGWLVFGGIVVWSGWWYASATVADRVIAAWLEERRAEGWAADVSALGTRGFPLRLETTLEGLSLVDPDTGVAWQAPRVTLTRPAYAPTDITVTLPAEHRLASPLEQLTITSTASSAQLSVAPTPALTVWNSAIALEDFTITSSQGWTSAVARADITTQAGEAPFSYIIRADLAQVAPGGPILRILDPANLLPESLARLSIDATVTFDEPWDIDALQQRRPQPRAIDLRTVEMLWGEIEVRVAGDMTVDENGVPEGDIAVQIVNWQALLDLLQSNGVLPQRMNALALRAVESLAQASGRPDTLDASLTLGGGFIRFGVIPIGPAPRFVIR
jgi:hypothetical protein